MLVVLAHHVYPLVCAARPPGHGGLWGPPILTHRVPRGTVLRCAVLCCAMPQGAAGAIYTGAQDGSVGAWSLDGRCRHLLPCHRGPVTMISGVNPPPPTPPGCRPGQDPHSLAAAGHSAANGILNEPRGCGSFEGCSSGGDGCCSLDGRRHGSQCQYRRAGERLIVTSGGDGAAGLWELTRGSLGFSPLLKRSEAGSLARVTAWDSERGVLLRRDELGVVRAWAPGSG